MAEKKVRSWARLFSIIAAGLLAISLISFATSMDAIEDILDPAQLNKGVVDEGDSLDLKLQSGRTYTLLRIVNEIGDEALDDDVIITDSKGNKMVVQAPTWMHPPRTGENGAIVYDTIGTYTTENTENFTFENLNSTSKLYIVDDHEGDLAATREPTLLVASFACCFGVLLLPIAGIIHLLTPKQKDGVLTNRGIVMPTDTIPTTDELFLISQGKMMPEDAKGIKPVKEVPPPFTNNLDEKQTIVQNITINDSVVMGDVTNSANKKQDDDEDDWKAWDTG